LKIVIFALGLFGLTATSNGCAYGGIPTDYRLSGTVIDKINKPLFKV
jgi:hypothetical protein